MSDDRNTTETRVQLIDRSPITDVSRVAEEIRQFVHPDEPVPQRPFRPVMKCGTWQRLEELVPHLDALSYPTNALPTTVSHVVESVASTLDVQVPMVASIAMAVLAMPAQAHVNVRRDSAGEVPISLFHLVLADSGDRKSAVERHFLQAYRKYNDGLSEPARKLLAQYNREMSDFNATKKVLEEQLRKTKMAKGSLEGGESDRVLVINSDLESLYANEPKQPRLPMNLAKSDVTVESMGKDLASFWPVASLIQSEGGVLFGGFSMRSDSAIFSMATSNSWWDGNLPERGRVGDREPLDLATAVKVSGAKGTVRVSMCIQVQLDVFEAFRSAGGSIAESIGWIPRFLIVPVPTRTEGRVYVDVDGPIPGSEAYERLLREILEMPTPFDEAGRLAPRALPLTDEAKARFAEYHDKTSRMSAEGGVLHPIKPAADKSPEQALRLAGLIQFVENRDSNEVSAAAMKAGIRVAAWHLWETFRVMGELAAPKSIVDAQKLEAWLLRQKKEAGSPSKRRVAQFGPVRQKKALDAALGELVDRGRVRITESGRSVQIELNPSVRTEGFGGGPPRQF